MVSLINLTLGGLIALIGVVILVSELLSRIRCSVPVTATVKSVKQEIITSRKQKQTVYRPQYMYTVNGQQYQGTAPFRSRDSKKYKKGQTLSLAYNPKNPGECAFRGKQSMLVPGLVIFAAGAIFILLYFILG